MPRVALKMYAIFDTVAEVLVGSVMLANNDATATRAFAAAVLNPQQAIGQNPRDFRLLRLGEVSDFGDVTPEDPTIVVLGSEILERAKEGQG